MARLLALFLIWAVPASCEEPAPTPPPAASSPEQGSYSSYFSGLVSTALSAYEQAKKVVDRTLDKLQDKLKDSVGGKEAKAAVNEIRNEIRAIAPQQAQERFVEATAAVSEAWSKYGPLVKDVMHDPAKLNDPSFIARVGSPQALADLQQAAADHALMHAIAPAAVEKMEEAWASARAGNNADPGGLPARGEVNLAQGFINQALGEPGKALSAFSEGIRLAPENPQGYAGRGQVYLDQGDYRRAFEDAKQALALDPRNKSAVAVYQMSKSRAFLAAAPALEPSRARAAEAAPRFASIGLAGPAPAPSAGDPRAAARLARSAQSALGNRDYAAAQRSADRALAADPGNLEALHLRAVALMRQGRLEDALRDAQAGLARSPKKGELAWLVLLANLYNRMKDYRHAEEAARRALALDPDSAEAHLSLAWALGGLGLRAEALGSLRAAARLEPGYQGYYDAALRLPDDANLALLFEKGPSGFLAEAPAGGGRRLPFLLMLASALFAGALLFWHKAGVAGWNTRVRAAFGPAAAPNASDAALPRDSARSAAGASPLGSLYQVTRRIGTGGMGVVYEAVDKKLGRRVAVKQMRAEIRSDARERARFLEEARLVAALKHPSIVEIYSIVEDGQDAYLVFEYVDGRTLAELLQERGRLPLDRVLPLARDVAEALDYAHARRIVHRDLKPSNIMVDAEGRARVMDFGVARQAKESAGRLSLTSTIAGTPLYMAPEQEQGTVRRESDVYALAVCLYEVLTGRRPFDGVGAAVVMAKINKTFAPPSARAPDLPKALDPVFARALEPDPDKRWATAGEFVAALAPAALRHGAA